MKALCLHPLFLIGAAVRLALVVAFAPAALGDWYAPFLQASVNRFGLDPWSTWLAEGGDLLAFPYTLGNRVGNLFFFEKKTKEDE